MSVRHLDSTVLGLAELRLAELRLAELRVGPVDRMVRQIPVAFTHHVRGPGTLRAPHRA